MKVRDLRLGVSGVELVGFALLILFVWLDEIIDLPHVFFGVQSTPINALESGMESLVILAVGCAVMYVSGRSATALARATAERDKLFSIIAHDLRSPFTVLLGNTEIIVDHFESLSSEELRTLAGGIHKSATGLFRLLQDLLVWAQIQLGTIQHRPERLLLQEVLGPVIELVGENASKKGISIHTAIDAESAVYADHGMVSSVLHNLLTNAIKFTQAGGRIEVTARAIGKLTEVTVSDTGVGIAPEVMGKLFHLGSAMSTPGTAGESGTGLGLILCHDLVGKNGGRLAVESLPGKGTAVTFSLPNSA
jgi:two-component system, sensor histidine kinase and response regulator